MHFGMSNMFGIWGNLGTVICNNSQASNRTIRIKLKETSTNTLETQVKNLEKVMQFFFILQLDVKWISPSTTVTKCYINARKMFTVGRWCGWLTILLHCSLFWEVMYVGASFQKQRIHRRIHRKKVKRKLEIFLVQFEMFQANAEESQVEVAGGKDGKILLNCCCQHASHACWRNGAYLYQLSLHVSLHEN